MVSPPTPLLIQGTQITMIVYSYVRQLQLKIHDLNEIIWVEVTGGGHG